MALTLVEAMAQHAGSLPPSGQLLCPVTGPGSWLLRDVWILEVVSPIVMLRVSSNSPTDLEIGFSSMAELRRKVVLAAVYRRAPAYDSCSLGKV